MMPPAELFERSPEIQEKIDTVRRMPANTEQEKAEKKESAVLLRKEILLENARFMRDTFSIIDENPGIKREDLVEELKKGRKVTHPDSAELFVDSLVKTRDHVAKGLDQINLEQEMAGKSSAKILFESLHKSIQNIRKREIAEAEEKGININVQFLPDLPDNASFELHLTQEFPLAVCLEVEDSAYRYIDPGTNVSGNYMPFKWIELHESQTKTAWIPVITVKGIGNSSTLSHEKGHSKNWAFKNSLSKANRITAKNSEGEEISRVGRSGIYHTVWGDFIRKDVKNEDVIKLSQAFDSEYSETEMTDNPRDFIKDVEDRLSPTTKLLAQQVVGMGLEHAKDELLADAEIDLRQEHGKNGPLLTKRAQLLSGRAYDYFARYGIERGSTLYRYLTEKYERAVRSNANAVIQLSAGYGSNESMFKKRIEVLPEVLAQIPLSEWAYQLERMGFEDESKAGNELQLKLNSAVAGISPISNNMEELSDEDRATYNAVWNIRKKAIGALGENSDRPLESIIKYYETQASQLLELVKTSDAYGNQQLYYNSRRLFGSLMNHTFTNHPDAQPTEIQIDFSIKLKEADTKFQKAINKEPRKIREHIQSYTKSLGLLEQEMKDAGIIPDEQGEQ